MNQPPKRMPIGKEYSYDCYHISVEKVRDFRSACGWPVEDNPSQVPQSFILAIVRRSINRLIRDPELGLNVGRLHLNRIRFQWELPLTLGAVVRTAAKLSQAGRVEFAGRSYWAIVGLTHTVDEAGATLCRSRWEYHQAGEIAVDG